MEEEKGEVMSEKVIVEILQTYYKSARITVERRGRTDDELAGSKEVEDALFADSLDMGPTDVNIYPVKTTNLG